MPAPVKTLLVAAALVLCLAGSAKAPCPAGDLTGDCKVNMLDLQAFALCWLDPPGSIADLVGNDGVNMSDFAIFANDWLTSGQITGSLHVVIQPQKAIDLGAKWRIDSGVWRDSGEIVELPVGSYTVEFSEIGNQWIKPASQNVEVEEYLTTDITETYRYSVVINEFMASNSKYPDPNGECDDWIEIYNNSNGPINIAGMYLKDKGTLWQVPSGNPSLTTVPSHGYLLIWADNDTGQTGLHTNFKLDADGDEIWLFTSDGYTLADSIVFGKQTTNISYGRYPDANDFWQFMGNPTPGSQNNGGYLGVVGDVKFSHNRGFYDAPFSVIIATDTNGADIYYTLDGSAPFDITGGKPALGATKYTDPIPITTTRCLRAVGLKTAWKPTNMDAQTYIFPAQVIVQSQQAALDAGYPSTWSGYTADYEMDPEIYTNPDYNGLMEEALLSIPTMSIATDKKNLFDPSTGIYTNPDKSWERPTSVEFFDSNGSKEFQINCGLCLQGGASRQPEKAPKHSFSLRFRGTYGSPTLNFPLFDGSPVESFDSVHLRAKYNNSWIHNNWGNIQRSRAQYIRDQWIRDSLLDMGEIAAGRGNYVHLYLNGMYWGLYNLCERQDASHYAAYYGGDKDRLDATKGNVAVDGDLTAWNEMKSIVAGRNWEQIQQVLDVDNYIDWTIINRFGGNQDLKAEDNWRAAGGGPDRRPWKLYSWDAERVLEDVNNTNLPIPASDPPGLFASLDDIDEFRIRFADRLHKHFFNGGALTPDKTIPRWTKWANELDLAIIGESARWGDYRRDVHRYQYGPYELYTKNDHWLVEKSRLLNTYFPVRSDKVLQRYKSDGLYPSVVAPVFRINGSYKHGGYILPTDLLSMTAPAGTIYYTIDGADPRLPGGSVNTSHAKQYTAPMTLARSTHVKARVKSGSTWSALNEATYAVGPVAEKLRITEIMYHPQDTNDPNDPNEEFIELKIIGAQALNLNLVKFTKGISFTFPDVNLAAGQYIVVVKDVNAFTAEYDGGVNIAGQYSGSLDNAGERIRLEDALGGVILDFEYKDGWREIADGDGFSLTIIDATNPDPNSWGEKDSWRASTYWGGSPGWDDSGILPNPGAVVINELLAHSHAGSPDWIELYNTTGSAINIGNWFLSDSGSNLKKYKIAAGTSIPQNGYKVFQENTDFNNPGPGNPGCLVPFALSENGETVYLSSAEPNGVLTGYRDVEDFGASLTDVSFGRYHMGSTGNYNFVAMSAKTPNNLNAYPKVGPIVINEIMYNPVWPTSGSYSNDEYEYVELLNISGSPVTLYDSIVSLPWKFTDGIDYTFPAGSPVTIPVGGYIVVVRNKTAFSARYPSVPLDKIYGPYSGHLDNGGESLELSQPGDVDELGTRYYIRVDRINYSDGSHPDDCPGGVDLWPVEADGLGKSLSRSVAAAYGNDPNNWTAAIPSPATGNP
jgi:hypothetical protein